MKHNEKKAADPESAADFLSIKWANVLTTPSIKEENYSSPLALFTYTCESLCCVASKCLSMPGYASALQLSENI